MDELGIFTPKRITNLKIKEEIQRKINIFLVISNIFLKWVKSRKKSWPKINKERIKVVLIDPNVLGIRKNKVINEAMSI